jgi:hypothetical protein
MSRMGSKPPIQGGIRNTPPLRTRIAMRSSRLAALVALSLVSAWAMAGPDARVDDKMAAVYDFAVVDRADRLDHVVAFVEIVAPANATGSVHEALVATAERMSDIDPGTARASAYPAVLSFSYDARRVDVRDVLARLAAATPVPVELALIQAIRPAYPDSHSRWLY